jgi:hypothetical protein
MKIEFTQLAHDEPVLKGDFWVAHEGNPNDLLRPNDTTSLSKPVTIATFPSQKQGLSAEVARTMLKVHHGSFWRLSATQLI